MEIVEFIRLLVLLASYIFLLVSIKGTHAPRQIVKTSLALCWVVGLLAALLDAFAVNLHVWHYVPKNVFFGLPPDLYIAGSLFAAGCGIIFWYMNNTHRHIVPIFLLSIPILGFLNDWLGNMLIGNQLPVWDTQYWFVVDIAIWSVCWVTAVMLYQKNREY